MGIFSNFNPFADQRTNMEVERESTVAALPDKPEAPALSDGEVDFDTYASVELRAGTVVSAEPVKGSDKLFRLEVDFGEGAPRQVLSGIRKSFSEDDLVGRQFAFVTNLPPRKMMGLESHGMILAADAEDGLALVSPTRPVAPGSRLH